MSYYKIFKLKQGTPALTTKDVQDEFISKYPKYKAKFINEKSGLMAQMTKTDTNEHSEIIKNGYHGVAVLAYQDENTTLIDVEEIIPSPIINHFFGKTGILDKLICNTIFTNGKDLYDSIDNFIKTNYQVDTITEPSLISAAKDTFNAMKGAFGGKVAEGSVAEKKYNPDENK